MGWLFGFNSPSEIRRDLNAQRTTTKLLGQKATAYGRHLWSVYETPAGEKFINLDLIDRGHDGVWGYKDMDESMGPCTYDCPLALLDLAGETTNEYAKKWRESVRAHHASKSRRFEPGQTVSLYGRNYRIEDTVKRSYRVRRLDDLRVFRMSPKDFRHATLVRVIEGGEVEVIARQNEGA